MVLFAASMFPEAFFELRTPEGQPIRSVAFAGPGAVGLAVAIGGLAAGGAFVLLWRARRFYLAASLLLIATVQAGAYASYQAWEFHESPEFCVRTCHVMEPTYLSFADPGSNLVMANHSRNDTAQCLDCHTGPGLGGQVDLALSSVRHVWKYTVSQSYDPQRLGGVDAAKTVPDANCLKCHTPTAEKGKLPEGHDNLTTQCALCHDPHKRNESGYFFPALAVNKQDCARCHGTSVRDFDFFPSKHADVALDDCRNCHTSHGARANVNGTTFVKGCTDSGCHDRDPANNRSLPYLNHTLFENASDCLACHGTAHNLTKPSLDALAKGCTTCHTNRTLREEDAHIRKAALNTTDCTKCHGAEPRPRENASASGAHGNFACVDCHQTGNVVNAPVPPTETTSVSQVTWQRQNNKNFDNWTHKGRGGHNLSADCGACHRPHTEDEIRFPVDAADPAKVRCDESCHGWLGDIQQVGYRGPIHNEYDGSINPQYLLNYSKDVDGDGRDHKAVYEKWGCTGFCHNPSTTLAAAEAWGKDGKEPTGIVPSLIHGNISKCTTCHRFESPLGGPEDLHTTHASLIQAEKAVMDPGGADRTSCDYCHSQGPYPQKEAGGCYNCHLSGHRPETYYWGE